MLLKASFQTALQIMLTTAVFIASWEKLLLLNLRASMNQEWGQIVWPSPGLVEYESVETEKADFNEIIDEFASMKHRKCFRHENAGYIGLLMDLCLSNTSNTCIALHNLLYHPHYMCFNTKEILFAVGICCGYLCKIYNLSANNMYKLWKRYYFTVFIFFIIYINENRRLLWSLLITYISYICLRVLIKKKYIFSVPKHLFSWFIFRKIVPISRTAMSNPNGLLSQKLCHCLDQGHTLNGLFWS